ncbi:MAG: four helix bundle protein [Anaerolineales bacterium]|nr:four helix bundle protein [Anaerolineales bacterium]
MDKVDLEKRTKLFALDIIRFVNCLPRTSVGQTMGKQLLRSSISIGANYREANRAESKAEFIHKINIVEKEAAETQYWLELMLESKNGDIESLRNLQVESSELLAIFTSIGKTSKARYRK